MNICHRLVRNISACGSASNQVTNTKEPPRRTNTSLKTQLHCVSKAEINDSLAALALRSLTNDSCSISFLHTFVIVGKNVTQDGFQPANVQREHVGGIRPTCSDHGSRLPKEHVRSLSVTAGVRWRRAVSSSYRQSC